MAESVTGCVSRLVGGGGSGLALGACVWNSFAILVRVVFLRLFTSKMASKKVSSSI